MRLTAALAKMLGLNFDEDAVELTSRQRIGPVVATKSAAAIVAEGKRLVGMGDPSVRAISDEAAKRLSDRVQTLKERDRRPSPPAAPSYEAARPHPNLLPSTGVSAPDIRAE